MPASEASEAGVPPVAPPSLSSVSSSVPGWLYSHIAKWVDDLNFGPAVWMVITPFVALYGCFVTQLTFYTACLAFIGYWVSGLGIGVGYHRLFAHRTFAAGPFTRLLIVLAGSSALQGTALWWAREHRAHHRFLDTNRDPYNAKRGLYWSHMGWVLKKQIDMDINIGVDISDLRADPLLAFQFRYYGVLGLFLGVVLPTFIAGIGWGDWWGGFYYAGITKSVLVLHSTFCINSLAHYVGDATFSDAHTARDNSWLSLITFGEGNHNFHHEFPYDYRCNAEIMSFDPCKWTIYMLSRFGCAYNLKRFPAVEIEKGRVAQQLRVAEAKKKLLPWGPVSSELPAFTLAEVRRRVEEGAQLIVIEGFVLDVAAFASEHPGGEALLKRHLGTDSTKAFNGGVYDHATGARNLTTSMRVGYIAS